MRDPLRERHAGKPTEEFADAAVLIERFRSDPARAFSDLLNRYTPELIRMIRRHMRDSDDVMEVYTNVCERLRARDFHALRQFREGNDVLPWLAVVAANASRDRFRRKRATSAPKSVLAKLTPQEQLVFRYYFRDRLSQEEIAAVVTSRHGVPCTSGDVGRAIGLTNERLSVKKRRHLLSASSANRRPLSVDELGEAGYEPAAPDDTAERAEELHEQEQIKKLSAALKELDADDRLMIMLRFEQEMTAVRIAELMRFENHKYVYSRPRTVTARLRRLVGEPEDL